MSYNILDVLDKLIFIQKEIRETYKEIKTKTKDNKINILSSVLIKEEERHIEYYKKLKEKFTNELDENIDFDIYDKISFLINQFKERLYYKSPNNVRELLEFALECEEQNKALLIDIQGRLVKNKEDSQTIAYKVLSIIIKEEEKHVKNIKFFIK